MRSKSPHLTARELMILIFLCASFILGAEDKAMLISSETGFRFNTFENAEGSSKWLTGESVYADISARSGNSLVISARLESDFSGTPVIADKALRELSLSWAPLSTAVITVGKQNLKWGTARVFSSIDGLSPPLDPLNPAGTDRGVTGIRADLIPTWWMSASLLALPAPELNDTRLALRTEFLAGETDLSAGAIRAVNADGDEEPAFFADAARFFDRFGVYGEARIVKKSEWEPSVTGGLQIDVPVWLNGTLTFLGEYRWQRDNKSASHMFYTGLSGLPLSRKLLAGASLLAAPEADQAVAGANLNWTINQSMSANLAYEYLFDTLGGSEPLIPVFTDKRHKVSAGVTAYY